MYYSLTIGLYYIYTQYMNVLLYPLILKRVYLQLTYNIVLFVITLSSTGFWIKSSRGTSSTKNAF